VVVWLGTPFFWYVTLRHGGLNCLKFQFSSTNQITWTETALFCDYENYEYWWRDAV